MARLYSNENFPLPAVEVLRELGHDVLTSHDAGRSNRKISDEEVLEYAPSQDRALLTLNRKHFVRLHKTKPKHSGIFVLCSYLEHLKVSTGFHLNECTAATHWRFKSNDVLVS